MAIARASDVFGLSMTNGRFDGFGDILIVQNGQFYEYLLSDESLMHQHNPYPMADTVLSRLPSVLTISRTDNAPSILWHN